MGVLRDQLPQEGLGQQRGRQPLHLRLSLGQPRVYAFIAKRACTGSTASADFPLSRPLLQDSRYPGTFVIMISDLPQEARNPTIGVYREGVFHFKNTLTTGTPSMSAGASGELFIRLGEPEDIPITGDWTGDGITDPGIFPTDFSCFEPA
jgi:hypothetical protein